jgi:toxin ParE1/3/4
MRLKWSNLARLQYVEQIGYIGDRNLTAALKIKEKVKTATDKLLIHPEIGRKGRCEGTRELVVAGTPIIIVYTIVQHEIFIVNILHAAQDYP